MYAVEGASQIRQQPQMFFKVEPRRGLFPDTEKVLDNWTRKEPLPSKLEVPSVIITHGRAKHGPRGYHKHLFPPAARSKHFVSILYHMPAFDAFDDF
jgi:hypothetical protein